MLGIDKRVEIRWIFVGLLALIPLIGALHLGTYNSPFAFAFASLIFMMFSRVDMSDSSFISTIVLAVAPSMFSVYFLHMSINAFGDGQVISLSNKNGLDALSITLFVFCECLVLDVPRRLIVAFAYPFLRKVYRTIDNLYEDLVSFIAQKGEP